MTVTMAPWKELVIASGAKQSPILDTNELIIETNKALKARYEVALERKYAQGVSKRIVING